MKLQLQLVVVMAVIVILASCKPKDNDTCVAGNGGNLTLALFPQHHGKAIYNTSTYLDTAYIKFNTQDFPGAAASAYDLVIAGEVGEEHIHVPNLKCGKYYIQMTGFDTSIHKRVVGGVPYSSSQTGGEIDLNVPVTE